MPVANRFSPTYHIRCFYWINAATYWQRVHRRRLNGLYSHITSVNAVLSPFSVALIGSSCTQEATFDRSVPSLAIVNNTKSGSCSSCGSVVLEGYNGAARSQLWRNKLRHAVWPSSGQSQPLELMRWSTCCWCCYVHCNSSSQASVCGFWSSTIKRVGRITDSWRRIHTPVISDARKWTFALIIDVIAAITASACDISRPHNDYYSTVVWSQIPNRSSGIRLLQSQKIKKNQAVALRVALLP